MGRPGGIKQGVRSRFDDLSSTYDQIHFLRVISLRLSELADLKPGDHVLDVAAGTGAVAISAARTVERNGKVVGIDVQRKQIEEEHLAELNAIISERGIFINVPAIFSFGHKPV